VQFHQGRLLDHVHVRVADLEASKRFYRAVLAAMGREVTREGENAFSAVTALRALPSPRARDALRALL
jgi:catechol 2,3-dioxygenase-like lactoylglutathione lyase family enzyme